jgi:hypothetical protein
MKSIPDVQLEPQDDPGESGGRPLGADTDKVWTITGRLLVRESEIDGGSHDRPLKGIEVKVSASDIGAGGPWTWWGTVRTDADGDFSLSETNNGRTRFFRVQARLVSADLEVGDGFLEDLTSIDLADRNWRTIWKSGSQLEGPGVSVGTRVFASGNALDLGDAIARRQALIWYVLRTAIDRLEDEDSWFALDRKVTALYPSHSVVGASYNDTASGKIRLHQGQPDDEWHPASVLAWFMLLWHDLHTHGGRKLSGYPSADFAYGFAAFASNALLHELWGVRLDRPLNRRGVLLGLELSTMDEIEGSDVGTKNALRLLRFGERHGWWSHLFGIAQTYPDGRPDDDGDGVPDHPTEVGIKYRLDGRQLPPGPHFLSLWDILRTFRATPAKGWNTDLNVSNPDNGVLAFIERAVSIHGLGEDVHQMLLRSIDPLAITEPFESLPKS